MWRKSWTGSPTADLLLMFLDEYVIAAFLIVLGAFILVLITPGLVFYFALGLSKELSIVLNVLSYYLWSVC